MKPYFQINDEFRKFEKSYLDHLKDNTGTALKNDEGRSSLSAAVQLEMAAFQHNRDSEHLRQRAIVIESAGREVPECVLEECCVAVQSLAADWKILPIRKAGENGRWGVDGGISKIDLVKSAASAGLIEVPSSKGIVAGAGVFIATLILSLLVIRSSVPGWTQAMGISLACAALLGMAAKWLMRRRELLRPPVFERLRAVLRENPNGASSKTFVSGVADAALHHLPMVVVVEDYSGTDTLSRDIIDHIGTPGKTIGQGAILWVIFSSMKKKIFPDSCSFPIRRYSVDKMLELTT